MKLSMLFTFLLHCIVLFSQGKRDTLRLYYKIDQWRSDSNDRRLDSLSGALIKTTYNVWIYGYADFLHTGNYNRQLSQRRADAVKERLLRNSSEPQMTIMTCKGMGEKNSADNGTPFGDAFQRRVDVIVEVRPPNKVVDTRPSKLKKTDTLHGSPDEIDVEQLKQQGKIVLKGLSFMPGRHTLLPKSVPVLEGLLTTMLQNPELKIMIEGHICCWQGEGDGYDYDSQDHLLSENRAKAVYDYLIRNGVEPGRMQYKGFGHSRPLVPEVSPATEQMNRRVEIRILD